MFIPIENWNKIRNHINFIEKDLYLSAKYGLRYIRYKKLWHSIPNHYETIDYPLRINFEVIDKCNLKCVMCGRQNKQFDLNRGNYMNLDMFKSIMDNNPVLSSIAFGTGDEPLLNKYVPDMIKYANAKGVMSVEMHTNGFLLKGELGEKLVKNNLSWLNISIDAFTQYTYSKIRVGSNLEKVSSNIRNLVSIKKKNRSLNPFITLNFIKMDINEHELDRFLVYWKKYVNSITVQKYIEMHTDDYQERELWACCEPFRRLWIRANGDVYPCCSFFSMDKKNKLIMGNINQDSIRDIWNNNKFKQLRKNLLELKNVPPNCLECIKRGQGVI